MIYVDLTRFCLWPFYCHVSYSHFFPFRPTSIHSIWHCITYAGLWYFESTISFNNKFDAIVIIVAILFFCNIFCGRKKNRYKRSNNKLNELYCELIWSAPICWIEGQTNEHSEKIKQIEHNRKNWNSTNGKSVHCAQAQ